MSAHQKISLSLTSEAIMHIKEIIARRGGGLGFRLSMKKYGCNGFGYIPEVIDEINPNDIEVNTAADFRVFVDGKFAKNLDGTIIDYVKKGLMQYQLLFDNPNAEGACGCGGSVNLKT